MGLNFYQLNNKQYSVQCTANSFPLIPKWMGLLRTEDTYWECPFAMLDVHGLAKVYFPRGKEDGSHVVIPCLYYLEIFQKVINIRWRVSVSEPKFKSDDFKAALRHEFPKVVGVWIFLLIKGRDNPKTLPLPYRAGGIKIHRPKYHSISQYVNKVIYASIIYLDVDRRRMILNHLIGSQYRNILI